MVGALGRQGVVEWSIQHLRSWLYSDKRYSDVKLSSGRGILWSSTFHNFLATIFFLVLTHDLWLKTLIL